MSGHRVEPLAVAELAAVAARGVDGVVGLDPGPLRSHATYGRGRRCLGVTLNRRADGPATVIVRLTAAFGTPLPELAAEVRGAVAAAYAGSRLAEPVDIDVQITDITAAPTVGH